MEHYGYIYLSTNMINGKLYIGRHSNEWVRENQKLDPKYMGSGIKYKEAVKKYGKENFLIEILEWCDSEEELIEREKYYLKENGVINNPDYYNRSDGTEFSSSGGCIFNKFSLEEYKRTCNKISKSLGELYSSKRGKEVKEKIRYTLWESLSPKEKEIYSKKAGANSRIGWENMSPEKREEFREKCKSRVRGKNSCARRVRCIETNEEFECIKDAKDSGYRGDIGMSCITGKISGGYHWEYIDGKGIRKVRKKKKYNCVKEHRHKSIRCRETGEIFNRYSDLAKILGCSVSKVRGYVKECKKLGDYFYEEI